MGTNDITVDSSPELVQVDRAQQTWHCPECMGMHTGFYGKTHSYCIKSNVVFQLDWRY